MDIAVSERLLASRDVLRHFVFLNEWAIAMTLPFPDKSTSASRETNSRVNRAENKQWIAPVLVARTHSREGNDRI